MAPAAISPTPISPSDNDPVLPFVSLSPLIAGDSSTTQSTARSLLSALERSGFLYLTDSPIPPSLLSRVYALSAKFFKRSLDEKTALAWKTPRSNRGYTRLGREKTSLKTSKEEVAEQKSGEGEDQKESFEIGRDNEEAHLNEWPEGDVEFKEVMLEFFQCCKQLHAVVMKSIALGFKLDPDYFADFVKQGDNTLRLLHYPAVPATAFVNGRVRAGLHSDYGSITFLFQDSRGGLQVEKLDGGFVDVTPIEGTIVMNAGDLLSRWSNGVIRSTRHRVVEPPLKTAMEEDRGYPPRYSIAYFCNPDFDKTIEALPGTWEDCKEGKKWAPVNSGDYLAQRLTATY
ncbi:MAG: hypothetical protein HETSPECPRED_003395 [Heterodermia speciosa]|uniref:Fe2OG dioxygenase domain-containing protein n=1 Tax=Heterodermia speciosa TaxID=116794 RepID=A0A8H3EHM1_9LECA|nr:MAG: hypothetical protein HETSPECPRED_003395 [Heterodermia speciosa]